MLARIGGDEFAIVQQQADQPAAAEALCRRLSDALAAPFEIDGQSLMLSASIGVVLIPGDGASADDLLKHADLALHRAKSDGRGSCRFFEADMDAELWRRKATEADLWRAFSEHEFELHYQPQIAADSQAVIGLEALLRWRHPEQGLVMPAEFLPVAEQTDLIMPLCGFVLREACARAAAWPTIAMSVNLSPAQFLHRELPDLVSQALDGERRWRPSGWCWRSPRPPCCSDTRVACEILDRLKRLGVRIAIDDFGTGYSSLSYLQKFDKIKIARSFTGALGRDERQRCDDHGDDGPRPDARHGGLRRGRRDRRAERLAARARLRRAPGLLFQPPARGRRDRCAAARQGGRRCAALAASATWRRPPEPPVPARRQLRRGGGGRARRSAPDRGRAAACRTGGRRHRRGARRRTRRPPPAARAATRSAACKRERQVLDQAAR